MIAETVGSIVCALMSNQGVSERIRTRRLSSGRSDGTGGLTPAPRSRPASLPFRFPLLEHPLSADRAFGVVMGWVGHPTAATVEIIKKGRSLVLRPRRRSWASLVRSLDRFTDDFMAAGRHQGRLQKRGPAFS